MAKIILIYRNILENSTVSVTTESTSFPKYRLYDRDIGKLFKATDPANYFMITANQGTVVNYEVDRLIIPAGHNLDGLYCYLQYSTDNFVADEHTAIDWTQSGSGLINKSFASPGTKQYWRLIIVAPSTIVELAEMFLGKDYTFERNPSYGSRTGKKKNIQRDETQSGRTRKIKLGEPRKSVAYDLLVKDAQKTSFESWDTTTEGMKSFYVIDEKSEIKFMELLNDLDFVYRAYGIWTINMELLEVL